MTGNGDSPYEGKFMEEVVEGIAQNVLQRVSHGSGIYFDHSEIEKRVIKMLKQFGAIERVPDLHKDIRDKFGLSFMQYQVLPSVSAIITEIETYLILESWAREGKELKIIHKNSYDGSGFAIGSIQSTLTRSGHEIIPELGVFCGYGNSPLFVSFVFDFRLEAWRIRAVGVRSSQFIKQLTERVDQYLVVKYQGKELNHKLNEIVLKKYDREDLIYPKKLGDKVDSVLRSFQRWFTSKKISMWGCFLIGGPGTGKTTIGGLLAKERPGGCTFLYCPAGEIEDPEELSKVFHLAKLLAPTVLQIDDIDLISRSRDQDDDEETAFTSVLMESLDGLREEEKIFVVLTTNDPSGIDGAVIDRAGRISRKVIFSGFDKCLPELIDRYSKEYELKISKKEIKKAVSGCLSMVKNFTPDEAKNICEQIYLDKGSVAVSAEDIRAAIKEVYEAFHNKRVNRSYLSRKS